MSGRRHIHLAEVGSTNAEARALAAAGAASGTVVSADRQTAGRGRQGRSWASPPGAVALSLIVRDPAEPALLPLAAAVATAGLCGPQALIKWPNDIWLDASRPPRKVAGILVETHPPDDWFIVGVGINAAVPVTELGDGWATLGLQRSQLPAFREQLVDALDETLQASGAEILAAWRARDGLRGTTVAWNGGEGVANGIDDQGRLLVADGDGALTGLIAGEVHLRR